MSDNTLFDDQSKGGEEPNPATPVTPAVPNIELPEEVSGLIGEGKKYADVTAALKSISHAQSHIEKLEEESARMRAELEKASKLDDVLSKFGTDDKDTDQQTTDTSNLDPDAIIEAVEARLAQKEQINQNKANLGTVKEKLVETYGEKAADTFNKAAESLGMSPQDLTKLASRSPQAALRLIGVPTADAPAPTNSDVNTEALRNQGEPVKHKNIMYGASTSDVLSEWRAAASKT
jgi:uncharacterized membrane-anchored protein YhcB (DUF1043 family)